VLQKFIVKLGREYHNQKSITVLFETNLSLLSRKIVERSAETGEHYITRSPTEYYTMVQAALGGGIFTAFTALLRIFFDATNLSYFGKGLLNSLNYSGSFIAMQAFGFSLATKQPAMTASRLAAQMEHLTSEKDYDALAREIIFIFRSQIAAIFGNLVAVAPTSLLLFWGLNHFGGINLFTPNEALEVLQNHSLFSMAPFYAAFTGVLLWLSSVMAGWMDNWFVLKKIPEAIGQKRSLRYVLGLARTQQLVAFLKRNVATFSANVSLGLLLGLVPKFAKFFGLPLDVRHVTLSTGTVTLAIAHLDASIFHTTLFVNVIFGILCIGAMNLIVSFAMASFVAMKAHRIVAPQRAVLYRVLFRMFWGNPFAFFLPLTPTKK